jgi:pimeloyl-ACP methyl ester carboxylesterase
VQGERQDDQAVAVIPTLLALLAAILAIGALYQRIGLARQRRLFRAPGDLLDVGGHRLHVACRGTGAPVVVFEAGIAASSLSWSLVQPAVAEFTRACAYDRAGLAWSDVPSSPRTFERIVDELAAVIAHASRGERCLLVGHSFGSFVVRAYASRHAQQVAGLVLIDPPIEWLDVTAARARMLAGGRRLSKLGALLAHLGVVRASLALLSGGAPGAPKRFVKIFGPTAARTLERHVGEVRKLPPAVHPVVQAHWSEPKGFHAMADYMRALSVEGTAIAALSPPREVPVAVISAGNQPSEQIAAHRALVDAAEHGVHIVAERSGHWVQFDEPELIVRVIKQLTGVGEKVQGCRQNGGPAPAEMTSLR